MGKQFADVSARYGAPMGRASAPDLDATPRTVRLFRVNLDSGGYDDGGAYWGIGDPLWCAMDRNGDMQFTRATTRLQACFMLGLDWRALRVPLDRPGEYAFALLDGRAPMPAGKDRDDVFDWMHVSGCAVGR